MVEQSGDEWERGVDVFSTLMKGRRCGVHEASLFGWHAMRRSQLVEVRHRHGRKAPGIKVRMSPQQRTWIGK